MLRAVTFDATGTLLHSPRLVEIYAEVLGRHGVAAPSEEVRRLMPLVWDELGCAAELGRDRLSAHPEGPRGWWRWFLERLCQYLGGPPPSRFAAAELYHRFGRAEAWEVFPEVPGALAELAGQGVVLAVVSNWDERLAPLLAELGLGRWFAAVVTSAEAGWEKPDPRLFATALAGLGIEPEAALHVGDSAAEDVEGALAAGMEALLLTRPGARPAVYRPRRDDPPADLEDLSGLPAIIAASRAPVPVPLLG
jgi:putative hydrolase of the HAD superfamily